MSSPFASVAAHRVNASQPPRITGQLDSDRCAALHNAIAIYGWLCSGRRIAEMDKKTWWAKYGNDALASFLRPSLVKFLKKCFMPSTTFFYFLSRLAKPTQMAQLGEILHDDARKESPKSRFITLYLAPGDLVTNACGIVYDQDRHKAIYMPSFNHVYDLENPKLPWQNLESILSIYIDMIEGGKAVALHQSIGAPAKFQQIEQPDGTTISKEIEPAGPLVDPYTGARKSRYNTHPWVLKSYTLGDLNSCLDIWERLFTAIETRAGIQQTPEDAEVTPLCGRSLLTAASINRGFAYDLLSHARQPQIWYVAPGLRLPGATEFINQPFKHIGKAYPKETEDIKMPFLLFRCDGDSVSAKDANFRWPFSTVEKVPCGLYLDAYPNAQNPFEDAIRLVLPLSIGGNKYAKFSDGRPTGRSHVNLYGHGINPFIMRHGPKLVAILENWLKNVETGHWGVDAQGVTGGVEVWRRADSDEFWQRYQSEHQVI